jgi:RimJ/RimL family protein N-acetyltransferase
MLFDSLLDTGYIEFPFNSNFLIWKNSSSQEWELCLKELHRDGYPLVVGRISSMGVPGSLNNTTNLAYALDETYRGQGIMTNLLSLYLEETIPDSNGFAVVIYKSNEPSSRLAFRLGFKIYEECDTFYFLCKN